MPKGQQRTNPIGPRTPISQANPMTSQISSNFPSTEITEYKITHYGGPQTGTTMMIRSEILLYNHENLIGLVYFYKNSAQIQSDSIITSPSGDMVLLNFNWECFPFILDTLRNEGPVYVSFNGDLGRISTSTEIVGEGELP